MTTTLSPGSVPLSDLESIYRHGLPARLDETFTAAVGKGAARIAKIAAGDVPRYGINTSLGELAPIKIAPADVEMQERDLIRFRCCGVGSARSDSVVRLIEEMLDPGVTSVILENRLIGASGDVEPLAHMVGVMIGASEEGERLAGADTLACAGVVPDVLAAEEGLALIDVAPASTGRALAGSLGESRLALISAAMFNYTAVAPSEPRHPEIYAIDSSRERTWYEFQPADCRSAFGRSGEWKQADVSSCVGRFDVSFGQPKRSCVLGCDGTLCFLHIADNLSPIIGIEALAAMLGGTARAIGDKL